MNKKLTALILAGTLSCAMTLPAMAAEATPVLISAPVSSEETAVLPDSVLYYGTVSAILRGEEGEITQLVMNSDRYGERMMNVNRQTVWIDSGNGVAADPAALQEGDRIYIFHNPVETMSFPPQSSAYAVVRNIPMDAGCAQYHKVEAVSQEGGTVKITTDQGGLIIWADDKTQVSFYSGGAGTLAELEAGNYVMAWYEAYAASDPGQTYASRLMLLPDQAEETSHLTRGQLLMLLYEQAGKPAVNNAMDFSDVDHAAEYAEAVRWAVSESYAGGYGNGKFGPDDAISREQLVTILWRYAGSPMLMDYLGLTKFSDVEELARYAQPAMAWACQKGYISAVEGDVLAPKGTVQRELAVTLLAEIAP